MTAQAGGTTHIRKARLRQQLRALRAGLTAAARRKAALQAARMARRSLRRPGDIAVYFSYGSELDTGPLIRALAGRHRLYLPRVRGARMVFVRYRPGAALRRNRFGISEPVNAPRARRLDAVLLPLLGFDSAGRRLGQGGGYYDRALSRLRARKIGFAFARQEVPVLPVEPHDVRLDAVITERGLRRFHR